ncbi:hypothetical protein DRQ15_01155 [candidate division KSB1 bacterium]|nr:STAS domain-containing protein [bacterium]RKY78735.1 MAG: hypothetical protein DRQ00_04755 [candidate division KSB1 bacterium]RKY87283.1 MAG: hypothetical protein DRQ11_06635 [candidate division KSB1 bacterium]RKY92837.1 MAG: hypothetical protein DRQ15_01155 [candidate division KSB1 bacterium]
MSGEHSFLYVKEEIEPPKKTIEIRSKKVEDTTLLYPRYIQRLDNVNAVPFYRSVKSFFLPGRKVILSMAKFKSIDSEGLALLVQLTQLAKKQRCYFALAEVPPPLARILKITEIDKLVVILPPRSEANGKSCSASAKSQKPPMLNDLPEEEPKSKPDIETL